LTQEAANMAPNEDLVWFRLGAAYLDSAKAQTDPQEKQKRNTEAYNDLQKAIDLKKKNDAEAAAGGQGQAPKKPEEVAAEKTRLAAYYDNFAAAAARSGKPNEAIEAYKQAAELDPAHAGNYYFNLGAILTNSATDQNGKKQAAEAFDKAIAADPAKADAYYWKGSNLMALATEENGKLVAPPGTAEAFQKYLELQPSGPHAEEAKAMLAAMNTTIESSYGKKGSQPPKKKP
ncbi:MAG TPA: hypothetical protein VFB00_04715, partial [Terriglobales bacterium]|nr:hypothetical protein [Terriglobales bacterium]